MKNQVKVHLVSVRRLQKLSRNVLRVNKDFLGKLCVPVLFDDVMFIAAILFIVDQMQKEM